MAGMSDGRFSLKRKSKGLRSRLSTLNDNDALTTTLQFCGWLLVLI